METVVIPNVVHSGMLYELTIHFSSDGLTEYLKQGIQFAVECVHTQDPILNEEIESENHNIKYLIFSFNFISYLEA